MAKLRVLSLRELWNARLGDCVQQLAWSPDSSVAAAASIAGPIHFYDAATGRLLQEVAGHFPGTNAIAFHPAETLLASCGQDGHVRLWSPGQKEPLAAFKAGKGWVECLAWNHDGSLLAAGCGKRIFVWKKDSWEKPWAELGEHASTVTGIAWHPSKNELGAASFGGVSLWKFDSGTVPETPSGQFKWPGASLKLAWSSEGRFIATADQTPTVHFWDMETGIDLQMSGYEGKIKSLAWHPKARFLATGGGPSVVVWDCGGAGPEGTMPQMLDAHVEPVTALAYQRQAGLLASGSSDTHVYVWWPERSDQPLLHRKLASAVEAVAWSPNDTLLLLAGESGELSMVRLPTEAEVPKP
jgi:WD40 repeat protein